MPRIKRDTTGTGSNSSCFTVLAVLLSVLVLCGAVFPSLHPVLDVLRLNFLHQQKQPDFAALYLEASWAEKELQEESKVVVPDSAEEDNTAEETTTTTMTTTTDATAATTAVKAEPKISMFDIVANSAYGDAIKPAQVGTRKVFDIKKWGNKAAKGGLTNPDRRLLGRIYHEAESVFEFGVGESTAIAASVQVPRYTGVDSDIKVLEKARANAHFRHFRFHLADVGEVGPWGIPKDKDAPKNVYNYQLAALRAETKPFDVYFIDGRYHVACAAASFLHAAKKLSRPALSQTVKVVLHDPMMVSSKKKGYYHALDRIAETIESTETMAVYRLRNNATLPQLYRIWSANKNQIV